MATQIPAE